MGRKAKCASAAQHASVKGAVSQRGNRASMAGRWVDANKARRSSTCLGVDRSGPAGVAELEAGEQATEKAEKQVADQVRIASVPARLNARSIFLPWEDEG